VFGDGFSCRVSDCSSVWLTDKNFLPTDFFFFDTNIPKLCYVYSSVSFSQTSGLARCRILFWFELDYDVYGIFQNSSFGPVLVGRHWSLSRTSSSVVLPLDTVRSTVSVREDVCEACVTKAGPVSFRCDVYCIRVFIRVTILYQTGGKPVVRVLILYLVYFMTDYVHPL
jgi:hypothetical protein